MASTKGANPETLRGLPAIELGRRVLQSEIDALKVLQSELDDTFDQAIKCMEECQGRVVVIGVGKSGHVGRKIAATLASTGTPAFFVHATEAAHGDLGMLTASDVVISISNSGKTDELLGIIGSVRLIGAKLIAITANRKSPLGRAADVCLCIGSLGEADPHGLAPTNTSTACLALGDALAITKSIRMSFTRMNFGKYHPGGALGREVLGSQFGRFAQWNQQHVFKFLDKLSAHDKQILEHDLETVDLAALCDIYNELKETKAVDASELSPVKEYQTLEGLGPEGVAKYSDIGLKAIAEGKLGLVLLAGGQASRFGGGFKGFLDIGLPSHKCLLRIQLERVVRVRQLAAEKAGIASEKVKIPVYVMVSHEVLDSVQEYLEEMNFFGLDGHDIRLFCQASMPCVTPDGKIILETSKRIARAPNGHGGVYSALNDAGLLTHMEANGVESVFMFALDNVLCKVADPCYVGYCIDEQCDFAYKLVKRSRFDEHAGVVCRRNGKLDYVEYWELPAEASQQKDENGNLVYDAANILNLFYTREFLTNVANNVKPQYHTVVRHIPCADEKGERTSHISGWKFQMNLLDCTPHAKKVSLLIVDRNEEYAPIKSGWGNEPDSPNSARLMLLNLHKKWIEKAGATLKVEEHNEPIVEVSPLVSFAGEGLDKIVKGVTLVSPVEIK